MTTTFDEHDPTLARETRMARVARLRDVQVELQVRDMKHATSEEVLQYCLEQLNQGATYNELRKKLGLGNAMDDRRWRKIRHVLAEMILPDSEEEALQMAHSMSNYMIQKLEQFAQKIRARALSARGEENEAQFLKLELDSMKMIMEKYDKQTEHFLKMKDLKKKEGRTQGPTVVFNNKFLIARPGEVPKDAKPISDATKLLAQFDDAEGSDE